MVTTDLQSDSAVSNQTRFPLKGALVTAGLCALLLIVIVVYFGSVPAFTAALRGETFVIEPGQIDLGSVRMGEAHTGTFTIRNLSSKPIRVVGATANCTCVSTNDLPLTVAARSKRQIAFRVAVNQPAYEQEIIFSVDDGSLQPYTAKVRARGFPSPASEKAKVALK